MNQTTDHLHVPKRVITRSNTKKIQVSNQENNGVADIGKWLEDLSLIVELPIKTIYECLIFFTLYLIAFIRVGELCYVRVISWAYLKAYNIQLWNHGGIQKPCGWNPLGGMFLSNLALGLILKIDPLD